MKQIFHFLVNKIVLKIKIVELTRIRPDLSNGENKPMGNNSPILMNTLVEMESKEQTQFLMVIVSV